MTSRHRLRLAPPIQPLHRARSYRTALSRFQPPTPPLLSPKLHSFPVHTHPIIPPSSFNPSLSIPPSTATAAPPAPIQTAAASTATHGGTDLHEEISNTPEVSETSPSPVIPAGQPPRPRSVVQIRRRLRSSISDSSNAIGSSPPHGPRGRTRLRRPSDTGDSRRSSPTRSRRASDRRNRREATSPGNTPRALQPQA
ncbi:hypothetical protein D5F01_LYC12222 [Larimichthys crocea]|uniref:Uncharacterized protein n=1 Tax=Larimichthys crocea TaxID=215358 RepID=A0A6G0IAM1_LARCR|nr:hypothetical protein D5F01_LYC12222 [Larimichthys crocea]